MDTLLRLLRNLQYKIYDLKGLFTKLQFKTYGINIKFFGNCNIKNPENISIGNNITFNDAAYLNGLGGIIIGNNVSISAHSIIVSTGLDPLTLKNNKVHINKKIIIGDNVQIGAGSIILAGVKIGDNVIVGAGSIVTKSFESDCIIAGNPAKVLRKLN